jgi:hypothetical protein
VCENTHKVVKIKCHTCGAFLWCKKHKEEVPFCAGKAVAQYKCKCGNSFHDDKYPVCLKCGCKNLHVGYIYFFQENFLGIIKIGYSKHPWLRVHQLNFKMPQNLEILGYMPADGKRDGFYHKMFEEHQYVPNKKEWYNPAPEILKLIKERSIV